MPFAILRIKKIKSITQLRRHDAHAHRRQPTPNADVTRQNEILIGSGDVVADVLNHIKSAGLDPVRLRRNGTIAVEVLLTASPEYFRPGRKQEAGQWDPERLSAWRQAARKFLRDEWQGNVVSGGLHLDESSPHIWATLSVVDNQPSAKRGPRVRLNASRWFDGPTKLAQLQDRYAMAMAPLGLQRGIRGSKAKHQDIKRLYGALHSDALAAEELSRRAALSLGAAEVERRAAVAARADADRDRAVIANAREKAEMDRAYAAAFRLGVEAVADGRIVGAVGTEEKPEIKFAPMPKTEEDQLRSRLRPAWTAVWRFAGLVEKRVQTLLGAAREQADRYLVPARAAYDRMRALQAALPARARARADMLGTALDRAKTLGRAVRHQ